MKKAHTEYNRGIIKVVADKELTIEEIGTIINTIKERYENIDILIGAFLNSNNNITKTYFLATKTK